jgi:hypothetical protein
VFGGGIDMTKDEALKLALEALESIEWHGAGSCWVLDDEKVESAEAALREAVAQPEQEPVMHLWECIGRWSAYLVTNGKQADCAPPSWLVESVKNATTPPKREWVDLTDEERASFEATLPKTQEEWDKLFNGIEAKLKEKNT